MKKTYKKPVLVIEDFRMDVSIAASCDSFSMEIEGAMDTLRQMYPGADEATLVQMLNDMGYGDYCYHTSQGTNVFNS